MLIVNWKDGKVGVKLIGTKVFVVTCVSDGEIQEDATEVCITFEDAFNEMRAQIIVFLLMNTDAGIDDVTIDEDGYASVWGEKIEPHYWSITNTKIS